MGTARRRKTAAREKSSALRVVITAGPTREYVDPVRYISNESSGRMGFEIARAAAKRGWHVTLIAGPVRQETPSGVERIDVESARDMLAATHKAFASADALFMAAAVADWRPKRRLAGKWRKKDDGGDTATLELVKNPDILATVARDKGQRLVIGFALETGDGERRARRKMARKNADFVVLNDDSALNAERTTVAILGADGSVERIADRPKSDVAEALVELVVRSRQAGAR
jgi:phosphopantothenoylcysteine decarboxylase/phosphopantothenate--cysteine ligase